ncbi:MAG: sigma-70 family RNA polymerase sigma factor [Lachnospiraceae bacterium]|nr:sigma-70 family RNA polymerase sigma factor [Lachnospiraceae bacterium]
MSIDINEQYDKIYRYIYFRLKNQHLAEDLTQETFLRFFESSSYKDAGRPLAYLYTIARNLCMDEFRKIPMEELKEDILQKGFEEEVVERQNLRQAMETLSGEEQELLLLRYVNEVSFADLCRLYGKSRFALYRELSRITGKLERRISDGT